MSGTEGQLKVKDEPIKETRARMLKDMKKATDRKMKARLMALASQREG